MTTFGGLVYILFLWVSNEALCDEGRLLMLLIKLVSYIHLTGNRGQTQLQHVDIKLNDTLLCIHIQSLQGFIFLQKFS